MKNIHPHIKIKQPISFFLNIHAYIQAKCLSTYSFQTFENPNKKKQTKAIYTFKHTRHSPLSRDISGPGGSGHTPSNPTSNSPPFDPENRPPPPLFGGGAATSNRKRERERERARDVERGRPRRERGTVRYHFPAKNPSSTAEPRRRWRCLSSTRFTGA
ncbi:hypothetical protein Hdeb2414_s0996g00971461 [Helianthus debilis subsp. tardiflorus]